MPTPSHTGRVALVTGAASVDAAATVVEQRLGVDERRVDHGVGLLVNEGRADEPD